MLRSFLGQGYYGTVTPPVLLRNILEDPGWYTQYTPYQSEISQGRLEILLNFQTLVADLTALPIAGASLLDEATAAAEAMTMCARSGRGREVFVADENLHPQTLAVMETRAEAAGIRLEVRDLAAGFPPDGPDSAGQVAGVAIQYPDTRGRIRDWRPLVASVHAAGALVVAATDLLALTLLEAPGEFGADIAVGSTQRFGMPMGGGGPHAAFLATRFSFARRMPGRVIGVSRDAAGRVAFRMALQTREQHIRRDRATSNICTAQVLPALVASTYAAWHGPEGLTRIARRVRRLTLALREGLGRLGFDTGSGPVFDTLEVRVTEAETGAILASAEARGVNLLGRKGGGVGISLDETAAPEDLDRILDAFRDGLPPVPAGELSFAADLLAGDEEELPDRLRRRSVFLDHEVFHAHRSEHEMLRYLHRLRERDPLAHHLDDPARLLHHEAERDRRDDPRHLARVRFPPPLRPAGAVAGLRPDRRRPRGATGPDHRLRRGEPAAERRLAGRVRRSADDPRLPPEPRRGPPGCLPDPAVRARDEPGERRPGRSAGGPGRHHPRRRH